MNNVWPTISMCRCSAGLVRFLWVTLLSVLTGMCSESSCAFELRDISFREKERQFEARFVFDKENAPLQAVLLGKPARLMLTLPGVQTTLHENARSENTLHEKLKDLSLVKDVSVHAFMKSTRVTLFLAQPMGFALKREGKCIGMVLTPLQSRTSENNQENVQRIAFNSGLDVPDKAKNVGPVSMDVTGLPLKSALMMLAESAGIDIVVSDQVEGQVSVRFNQLPWATVLDMLMKAHGLMSQRQGDALLIRPAAGATGSDFQYSGDDNAALAMEIISLKHARAENLLPLVNEAKGAGLLSSRGHVVVDARTNQLLVSDTPNRLERIRATLTHLDVPLRQVQIEARIVVARENVSRRLGVRWGKADLALPDGRALSNRVAEGGIDTGHGPFMGIGLDLGSAETATGSLGLGFIDKNIQLGLELNAMELEGLSQTLSQPRIMTLDREPANIRQGQEIPYQNIGKRGATHTTFRDAVLALEVVPHIRSDDRVLMKVDIQNDSVAGHYFNGLPAINTSRIKTQVIVDNGETVVLGGILSQKQSNDLRKVPWLGDLPGLGKLFRYAEKAQEQVELLVFLTPNIIDE